MLYAVAVKIINDLTSHTHAEAQKAIRVVLAARVSAEVDKKLAKRLYSSHF